MNEFSLLSAAGTYVSRAGSADLGVQEGRKIPRYPPKITDVFVQAVALFFFFFVHFATLAIFQFKSSPSPGNRLQTNLSSTPLGCLFLQILFT